MRVRLVQLEDDEQVLLVTLHHIIADGWSMGVLMEKLSTQQPVCGGRGEPV